MGNMVIKDPPVNSSPKGMHSPEKVHNPSHFPPPEHFRYPDYYHPIQPIPFENYGYENPSLYPYIPPIPQIYSQSRRTISRQIYPEPYVPEYQMMEPSHLWTPKRETVIRSPIIHAINSPSQIRPILDENYNSRISSPSQRQFSSLAHPLPVSRESYSRRNMRKTGQPTIIQEKIQSPAGIGTRTIIEEPFEIDQPPSLQKIRKIVNRPVTIPQPPETTIIEEVVESPIIVHPPPQRKIVREVVERPVSIPQPPERKVIREVYKRPIEIHPPPEKRIVHDVVRRSILVDQPPKSIMIRKEYEEKPIFFESSQIEPNYRGGKILQHTSFATVDHLHPSPYSIRESNILSEQQIHHSPIGKKVDIVQGYSPQIAHEYEKYPRYVSYPYEEIPVQYPGGYGKAPEIVELKNQEIAYNVQPGLVSSKIISSAIPEVEAEQEKVQEIDLNEQKNLKHE